MEKQIELHCDQIKVIEGRNPRLMLQGIEDLAESILENGVVTPIKVESKGTGKQHYYTLIDGHRRLAACHHILNTQQIHIKIPAIVVSGIHNESDVLVQMMVANDSVPFVPLEEATLFRRLLDEFNFSVEDIAKRVGKSMSFVSDRLALFRADPMLKEAVREGAITPADANTIIRKSRGDQTVQRETTQRVLDEGREQVIDKELKKGRMPRPAWDIALITHDQVWQAGLTTGGGTNASVVKEVLKQEDPIGFVSNLDAKKHHVVELAFYVGKLQAFAEFSNLSLAELWNKIEERNNI